MNLSHLHLEHFRNYTKLDFAFPDEPIVVLSGENAQGKTSFLEALYMLALTKSFRISDRDFLRQFEQDYYRIEAKINTTAADASAMTLELCELNLHPSSTGSSAGPAHQRVLKKNGIKISAPKFIGHLKVVLFRPEDLQMLTEEPGLRRRYLNSVLIQTVPGYMKQLQLYQKLLTQRNALLLQAKLKNISRTSIDSQLDLWDEQLAEAGSALVTSRMEYTEFVAQQLREQGGVYSIDYETAGIDITMDFDDGFFTCRSDSTNTESVNASQLRPRGQLSTILPSEMKNLLLAAIKSARTHDLRSTHTSVGPHRDDLKLSIHGRPLNLIGSRGELRTALMQLKQAEIAWIQHIAGDMPIILLDDVFSELDSSRKNDFLQLIPEGAQAILTVAEGNPLPHDLTANSNSAHPKLRSASTVRKIHAGMISPATGGTESS